MTTFQDTDEKSQETSVQKRSLLLKDTKITNSCSYSINDEKRESRTQSIMITEQKQTLEENV